MCAFQASGSGGPCIAGEKPPSLTTRATTDFGSSADRGHGLCSDEKCFDCRRRSEAGTRTAGRANQHFAWVGVPSLHRLLSGLADLVQRASRRQPPFTGAPAFTQLMYSVYKLPNMCRSAGLLSSLLSCVDKEGTEPNQWYVEEASSSE